MRTFAVLFSVILHAALAFGIYWHTQNNSNQVLIPLFEQTPLRAQQITESELLQKLNTAEQNKGKQAIHSSVAAHNKKLVIIQPVKKKPKKQPKKEKKQEKPKDPPPTKPATETAQKDAIEDTETSQEEAITPQQQQLVTRYQRRIQSALINSWTRPSNIRAHQDLSVQIALELNQDGTVKTAKVHESSGDLLFDRSAIAAIKKNIRFAVPEDTRLFEQYFSHIVIAFANPN